MEGNGRGAAEDGICLPAELRLHVLSLLPPVDLALGGRLSSKDAALHFTEPTCRTTDLRQPLPHYATTVGMVSAQSALRQLTFRQKLHLPATAATSGCEANVEFALQLLQPHVFPEVLRTDGGYTWAYEGSPCTTGGVPLPPMPDVGSAAVASGLAHLLPSLEQRCPGLLDPGRTLEAAARHCDLAGLQAAWEALGQRLLSSIRETRLAEPAEGSHNAHGVDDGDGGYAERNVMAESDRVWQRMMAEAAGSLTPDALAKMAWVLEKCNMHSRAGSYACERAAWGAAAASGDMGRVVWLLYHCSFNWRSTDYLQAVLQHASLDFLQELEQQGHLPLASCSMPSADLMVRVAHDLGRAAAGSPRDSAAKLRWLEGRATPIGFPEAVEAAAEAAAAAGNLEALQLLLERRRQLQLPAEEDFQLELVEAAVCGGHVSTAAWLVQAGWPLTQECLETAVWRGDLPMVRWLVEAGCPRGELDFSGVVAAWPCRTVADSRRLVEVLRLVVEAGWPLHEGESPQPLEAVVIGGQPWPVWCVLRELLPSHADGRGFPHYTVTNAARAGCEAALEGMVREGNRGASIKWYADAAGAGDRGTLECVQRLGVPLAEGVLRKAVASSAPLAALRWLEEQGMPVKEREVKRALKVVTGSYPREQEQREVRAWLRGLRGGGMA